MLNLFMILLSLLIIGLPWTFFLRLGITLGAGVRLILAIVLSYWSIVLLGRLYLSNLWPFSSLIYTLLGISVFTTSIQSKNCWNYWQKNWRLVLCFFVFIFGGAIAVGVPLLGWNLTGSPLRIGPDGILYAHMADFLTHGGTLSSLPPPPTAYSMLVQAGFKTHLRWGYPFFLAFASLVTGTSHPFDHMFVSTWILFASTAAFIFFYLTEHIRASLLMSAGALGLIFNSLLLNMLLENQQPNVGMVLSFTIMVCLYSDFLTTHATKTSEVASRIILLGLFWAASLVYYSEILPIVIAYLGAMLVLTIRHPAERQKTFHETCMLMAGSLSVGFVLVGTFASTIFSHLTHLETAGATVGYPQSLWAWPHNFLGFSNLYSHVDRWFSPLGDVITRKRDAGEIIGGSLLSLAVVTLGITQARQKYASSRIWLPALPLIGAILLKSIVKIDHNYLYTKVCALCVPFLVLGFVCYLSELRSHLRYGQIAVAFFGLWMICLLGAAANYLLNYRRTSEVVTSRTLNLNPAQIAESVLVPTMRGCGGNTYRMIDRTREAYFFSFRDVIALDAWTFCTESQMQALQSESNRSLLIEHRSRGQKSPSTWEKSSLRLKDLISEDSKHCRNQLQDILPCDKK
ncbi:MAG: hypothetical protein JST16_00470 [Bdellovibrionales bacterium]|nr:hypothetical protein [Bdellovibrionales bacterium]